MSNKRMRDSHFGLDVEVATQIDLRLERRGVEVRVLRGKRVSTLTGALVQTQVPSCVTHHAEVTEFECKVVQHTQTHTRTM